MKNLAGLNTYRNRTLNVIFITILLLSANCTEKPKIIEIPKTASLSFEEIKSRGKLVAVTGYNAYSYFIYRGRTMGFEYELVKELADFLDVELEIVIEKDIKRMFEILNSGRADLIAFNLTVTNERKRIINFTDHLTTTRQVLVQRRPNGWRRMKMHEIDKLLVRDPLELDNKTIHVVHNSSYEQRLIHLSDEIGGDIKIVISDSGYVTEDMIKLVADGEIDYTISDENIAELNQANYSNIDIGTRISLKQKIAWGVGVKENKLLAEVNDWIRSFKSNPDFYYIYDRYFENRIAYKRRVRSQFFSNTGGKISKYDKLLKKYSSKLDWDWRILASQIYQESQFDPYAKSWAGAIGLMQLMPETAKYYGVKNPLDPYESLEAGVNYLQWLDDYWKEHVIIKEERIKFVLASYNVGFGHIIDAMKLAEKYGADHQVWEGNVEKYLLLKANQKYYNDPVVSNGYCRGIETVEYVKEIFERFTHYKKFIS